MKKKIMTIVGARPQFVKAAMLSREIEKSHDFVEVFIHTGQHYDDNMSTVFFSELNMKPPHYNLAIGSGQHGRQTGEMMASLEAVMIQERPDWVLIYGDTNSTLAGALVAAKLHIPIAHVEAGLRSFNKKMPEEINRIVSDHVSTMLFAPTEQAVKNLLEEGVKSESICLCGDIMFDAAKYFGSKAATQSKILSRNHLTPKSYILVTIHRAENTDDKARLTNIFHALCNIASLMPVVLPLHPRTKKMLIQYELMNLVSEKIILLEPASFLDMIQLEKNSCIIVTDSGGVQKEAFFYFVPCVTLREETEWVETVALGWNKTVSPNNTALLQEIIMNSIDSVGDRSSQPYGDGNTAKIILEKLRECS